MLLLARSTAADDAGLGLTLLNVLVLLPVALACVYAVASQLGGMRLGVVAAAVWAVTPFALAPLWDARYETTYEGTFLVHAVGLTEASAFRALVALLLATVLAARAVRRGSLVEAGAAGLVVSLALAVDASTVLFLAAPAGALLAARRWRESATYAIALLPGLVVLVVRDPVLPSFPDGDLWGTCTTTSSGCRSSSGASGSCSGFPSPA